MKCEKVDAVFIRDDEHMKKIGKLQKIFYHLEENNFTTSVNKLTGIGFNSIDLIADLIRSIMNHSLFYKSKVPLLVRLISELNLNSDIN